MIGGWEEKKGKVASGLEVAGGLEEVSPWRWPGEGDLVPWPSQCQCPSKSAHRKQRWMAGNNLIGFDFKLR